MNARRGIDYALHVTSTYGRLELHDGRLVCHECGKNFLHLGTHIRRAHGTDAESYRKHWGLGVTTPLVAPAVSAALAKKASLPERLDHLARVRDIEKLQEHRGRPSWRAEVVRKSVMRGEQQRRPIPPARLATLPPWEMLREWAQAAHRIIDDGYSIAELARAAGRPTATVAQRLRRHPAAPTVPPRRALSTDPVYAFADDVIPIVRQYLAGLPENSTRRNARMCIIAWLEWCAQHGEHPLTAQRTHVEQHLVAERDRGLAPTTVSGYISSLNRFYEWLIEHGHSSTNPLAHIRRPRRRRYSGRRFLGRDDLTHFLAVAREQADPYTAVAIHLNALSGTRPGETLLLDHEDIGEHAGRMVLTLQRGKHTAIDRISIPDITTELIRRIHTPSSSGPLLLGPSGERLQKSQYRTRFRAVVEAAEVPYVTPYDLRAGMITLALEAGIPERDVMIAAGHASSQMTAHYDRLRSNVATDRNAGVGLAEVLGLSTSSQPPITGSAPNTGAQTIPTGWSEAPTQLKEVPR